MRRDPSLSSLDLGGRLKLANRRIVHVEGIDVPDVTFNEI
jgi:hypothetical protein